MFCCWEFNYFIFRVQRTLTTQGLIILKWESNTEKDLKGYFIQRSLNDDNNEDNHFININTVPIDSNNFTQKLSKNVSNKFVYRIAIVRFNQFTKFVKNKTINMDTED